MKVLARVSIPPRLRGEMLLKEGSVNSFDIPHNREGLMFLNRWKKLDAPTRDALMKQAYAQNIPIHQVKNETLENGIDEDSE